MNFQNIYFIGIGGIGMSALAQMLASRGIIVSGSDAGLSLVTEKLIEKGIQVFCPQFAGNLPEKIDAVVYTLAIAEDNPEFVEAKKRGVPMFSYAEFLGKATEDYKTIAVSGTHGKTTTTAMVAKVLKDNSKDPSVVVGSLLKEGGSNFISGQSDLLVIEACEYKRSFLNFYPQILVITNIEEDHLDYYKDLADIQNAFHEIAARVPADGYVIADTDDEKVAPVLENISAQIIDYKKYIAGSNPGVPGEHNKKNGACAMAIAEIFNIEKSLAQKALAEFTGTWRRFEYKGRLQGGGIVYDDYGHHPSEIIATLKGAREKFPDKEIIVLFEPHLYSRTKIFMEDFAGALSLADKVFVLSIYAAREKFDPSVTAGHLAEKIKSRGILAEDIESDAVAALKIQENDNSRAVFILLGAGDVYKISDKLSYA